MTGRPTDTHDSGYIRGLMAATRWLNGFAGYGGSLPGIDRDTCAHLTEGMQAMADSARQRLDVDAEPVAARRTRNTSGWTGWR